VPVQGAANPTGYLSFGSSVNGAAYSDGQMVLTTAGNVGIGTTTPTSLLHVSGAVATAIVNKTANYTAAAGDSTITVDTSTAAVTITLPTAVGISGRMYTIKKVTSDGNAVTVDGNASETVDSGATYSLPAQWSYVTIQSNGANWLIIANGP
jgi:hypothetical protein